MILNPVVYQSGGGGDKPVLLVTVTGQTAVSVVASKSGTNVSLAYDSTLGKWWAYLPSTGTWTVTATWSTQQTKTKSVSASSVTVYEITLSQPVLPSGYTELEYIQSSRVQYINTGIMANGNIETEMSYCSLAYEVNGGLFGLPNQTNLARYYNFCYYNNKYYWGLNNSEANSGTVMYSDGDHLLDFNGKTNYSVVLDGTTIGSGTMPTGENNIYLFTRGFNTPASGVSIKLYYANLYNKTQNAYVRKYLPCKRDPDSEVGLYDLISNSFFANDASGDPFVAGPEA